MTLDLTHEVRDPIHGLIYLTDLELAVIDTPVFQRLRRIRQLAMADLVYPGALHTRFEHVVGTMHVAHRIIEALDRREHKFDNDDWQTVRLAALLHDIGHGPFSHVSEYVLEVCAPKSDDTGTREKIHELITFDILRKDDDLVRVLGGARIDEILRILEGEHGRRDFRRDIVSSALDADKMDYLLRDAYFTGVAYGRYDLDKLVDSFRVHRDRLDSFLAVDESGVFALEQLVLAKHHMTQQVYAHRVRNITDQMIVRGLLFAIGSDPDLERAYTYDSSDAQLKSYVALDDVNVSARARDSTDPRAARFFDRLHRRDLLKEIDYIPIDKDHVQSNLARYALAQFSESERISLETGVAEILECEPWEVIVYLKRVQNPMFPALGPHQLDAIQVVARDGLPKSLDQIPELVVATSPDHERLHVLGPVGAADGNADRMANAQRRDAIHHKVRQLIEQSVGRFA